MSKGSSIEWTDDTWNCITGCTRVSAGCDSCYSARLTYRLENMGQEKYTGLTVLNPRGDRHFNGVVKCHEDELSIPLRWKKPRRIFVNSMSDTFHRDVPFDFIDKMFAVMALTPQHTYQVLTKRPERMLEYLVHSRDMLGFKTEERIYKQVSCWLDHQDGDPLGSGVLWDRAHRLAEFRGADEQWSFPLPNVWLGFSAENQGTFNERASHMAKLDGHAAKIFASFEPLIGPIDLGHRIYHDSDYTASRWLDWGIVGGESGPGARPMHPEWARSIRDQCKAAGVAFFFKQWGEFAPVPQDGSQPGPAGVPLGGHVKRSIILRADGDHSKSMPSKERPDAQWMIPCGKKAAGRLLDGVEHNEFPKASVTA